MYCNVDLLDAFVRRYSSQLEMPFLDVYFLCREFLLRMTPTPQMSVGKQVVITES